MSGAVANDVKRAEVWTACMPLSESMDPDQAPWLTALERSEAAHWKHPARRLGWLAGRQCVKQLALALWENERLDGELVEGTARNWRVVDRWYTSEREWGRVECSSRDAANRGMRPTIACDGQATGWWCSISHDERCAWGAVCRDGNAGIGVDVLSQGILNSGFQALWFTEAERAWLAGEDSTEAAWLWSAKEAAFKAGAGGETFAPQEIEVRKVASGGRQAQGFQDGATYDLVRLPGRWGWGVGAARNLGD